MAVGEPVRLRGWRTPVVSLGAAVLAGLAVAAGGPVAAHLLLAALTVVLVATDLSTRRLPNVVVGPGVLGLAGLLALTEEWSALGRAGIAAAALFAVFLGLAVISPAGMGMGDVKLAALLGLALGFAGWDVVLLGMLAGFALHAVVSLVLLATRRVGRTTQLPFGPALLVGAVLALGWFAPVLPG